MRYKLIACDLDRTLLDSNGDLRTENYDAISELSKQGVLFVPTTGRAYFEIPAIVRNHPAIRYFISSNGAIVQDVKRAETLVQNLIPGETVKSINEIARKCNLMCTNHMDNVSYTIKELFNDTAMIEYNVSKYFKNQIYTCTTPIENYFEKFANGEPCEMIAGCFKSEADKMAFFEVVDKIHGLRVSATGNCIEIVSASAGKDVAVKKLIDILGIDIEEIITVGDGENDISMIKLTRNSIAVSNASKEVKSVAGRIGCSNDEHILRYVLEKIIK